MQYYLFRFHNINPKDFMKMGRNEKKILYAFMRYEMEERAKDNNSIDNKRRGQSSSFSYKAVKLCRSLMRYSN